MLGAVLAMILIVSAVSTDYWSKKSLDTGVDGVKVNLHFGLWRVCADGGKDGAKIIDCKHLPPDDDPSFPKNSLYAARVFAILAAILSLCSIGCLNGTVPKKWVLMCLVAAALCALIAISVWAAELMKMKVLDPQQPTKFDPSYSFYAMIVGAVILLVLAGQCYANKN